MKIAAAVSIIQVANDSNLYWLRKKQPKDKELKTETKAVFNCSKLPYTRQGTRTSTVMKGVYIDILA